MKNVIAQKRESGTIVYYTESGWSDLKRAAKTYKHKQQAIDIAEAMRKAMPQSKIAHIQIKP